MNRKKGMNQSNNFSYSSPNPFSTLKSLVLFCLFSFCLFSCDQIAPSNSEKDTYLRGEMPVQHGMELFNQHCASCHNFSENGIGPNLAGVTSEVSKEWLVSFIANPPAAIEGGDERAVKLFEKYKQYMPPFPMIQGEDLEDMLAFIHKFSQGEKRNKKMRKGALINPILEKIDTSNLTLVLEEWLIAPRSSEIPPFTRINKLAPIPGGRLFFHDLRGKLYEISADKNLTEYIDLATIFSEFIDNPGKGSGLGSWVFHPEFEKNGLFYTTHTEPKGTAPADFPLPADSKLTLQSVLVEWKANTPEAPKFEGSHRELLRVDMVGAAHTFQELIFNPLAKPGTAEYGKLYLGIGDGSAALAGYPNLCDSREHIWGSVIRIDPKGQNSANGKYGIPPDNPFVNDPKAVQEIWAYGFRNPHRITWDETGSGKMLITNIGQHSVEEINLGIAGAHYGWPYREGTFVFDVDANPEVVYPLPQETDSFHYPVVQYDHDEGSAISGGFVYDGKKLPQLKGKYIFGDISRGMLFYADVAAMVDGQQSPAYRLQVAIDGELSDMESISQHKRVDLRLGIDQAGELYLMTKGNGGIYQVVGCLEDLEDS